MNEWLESFYNDPDLRRTLLEAFLPVFDGYVAEALGGPVPAMFVESLAESYVDRHLGSSLAQLQGLLDKPDPLAALSERFDEWEEKRPEKVAKNELIRSANAAQVQQMREAGVEKMIWRASGGACPFCNELDGVIISVSGTFFEPGDELNPEGVESPIHFESTIGHPPVHQGCTCFVEAVVERQMTNEEITEGMKETGLFATPPDWAVEKGFQIDYWEHLPREQRQHVLEAMQDLKAQGFTKQIATGGRTPESGSDVVGGGRRVGDRIELDVPTGAWQDQGGIAATRSRNAGDVFRHEYGHVILEGDLAGSYQHGWLDRVLKEMGVDPERSGRSMGSPTVTDQLSSYANLGGNKEFAAEYFNRLTERGYIPGTLPYDDELLEMFRKAGVYSPP